MDKKIEDYEDMISIAYKLIEEKNIDNGVILFPFLRIDNASLVIGIIIEENEEELFKRGKFKRPHYWATFNIRDKSLIEFNDCHSKDYMKTNFIPLDKEFNDDFTVKKKEVDKFIIDKQIQYKDYLTNDLENELNNYDDILKAIDNKIIIDGQIINAKDYIIANIEDIIIEKSKDLTDIVTSQTFSFIYQYYKELWSEVRDEYIKTNKINKQKLCLMAKIMETYYGHNYGIKYFFNIES